MPVIDCDTDVARSKLDAAGATIVAGNTEHEHWRADLDGTKAIAYDGKVVVQGRDPYVITSILDDHSGRAHLYFDGASRGNPGPGAVGWVLVSSDGIIAENGARIGETTNNRAEYEALIHGVTAAHRYGFDELHIRGDSELVVKQLTGEWEANDPTLREYRVRANELLTDFDSWTITHIPRDLNERADELATTALDE